MTVGMGQQTEGHGKERTSASGRKASCLGSLTCTIRPPRVYDTSPLMGCSSSNECACTQACKHWSAIPKPATVGSTSTGADMDWG